VPTAHHPSSRAHRLSSAQSAGWVPVYPSAEVRDLLFYFGQKSNCKCVSTSDMQFKLLGQDLEFSIINEAVLYVA